MYWTAKYWKQICRIQCCKEENLIICISHKFSFRLPPQNYADCSKFVAYKQKSCIFHFISSHNIVWYFKMPPQTRLLLKKKSQDTPLIQSPIKNRALSRTDKFLNTLRMEMLLNYSRCWTCSRLFHMNSRHRHIKQSNLWGIFSAPNINFQS